MMLQKSILLKNTINFFIVEKKIKDGEGKRGEHPLQRLAVRMPRMKFTMYLRSSEGVGFMVITFTCNHSVAGYHPRLICINKEITEKFKEGLWLSW